MARRPLSAKVAGIRAWAAANRPVEQDYEEFVDYLEADLEQEETA